MCNARSTPAPHRPMAYRETHDDRIGRQTRRDLSLHSLDKYTALKTTWIKYKT